MCNNIMVCKFLIQDLKVSLCIANLVHMTAVMVSPALKAQKQELSLQDRVTYNMKVLIAIRQTSQKDLAQAMELPHRLYPRSSVGAPDGTWMI